MFDNRTAFDKIGLSALQRRLDLARGLGRNHFGLEIEGRKIGYCYVRKNGCSSFKRMFLECSAHRADLRDDERPIDFMRRYHRLTSAELAACDNLIFVFRDPVQRMLSMFRNKFIAGSGAEDIRRSYEKTTGKPVETATFRDFITDYLSRDFALLDRHVLPQRTHLQRALYTDVLPVSDLYQGMSRVLGAEMAAKYFLRPANSTFQVPLLEMPGAADMPVGALVRHFEQEGSMPDDASLLPSKLARRLRALYAMDYGIIGAMKETARSA
ncbi:sulfotransferase family 2 domain-containing protein [Alloyangia pacifica]|uniref:sulfotransferase family 2 domain-containing protein n=1 Tax=Alloyangia pacifica TaxID=311180 RepID=UPI001CD42262|nr:sulfotransferase family 2 domain-containing protein [Alloyangia pacifica]MCA0997315.1 sulfotransferase family protein [Alloyangia pacifica]